MYLNFIYGFNSGILSKSCIEHKIEELARQMNI